MKKITVQPTIHDLKPEPVREPRVTATYRVNISLTKKLINASRDMGYSQNELVNRALEAFFK